jgi:hypothetical protein
MAEHDELLPELVKLIPDAGAVRAAEAFNAVEAARFLNDLRDVVRSLLPAPAPDAAPEETPAEAIPESPENAPEDPDAQI